MNLFRRHKEHHDAIEYHVTVEGYKGGEYDLIFDSRDKARAYKRALKDSKRKLQAQIKRREYIDDYILDEKEVY